MNCAKCAKELVKGDRVVEILSAEAQDTGVHAPDITINSIETLAVLCENCEAEVMPALWADINELTADGKDDYAPPNKIDNETR